MAAHDGTVVAIVERARSVVVSALLVDAYARLQAEHYVPRSIRGVSPSPHGGYLER
jgi:hypothetical protein